MSVYLNRKSLRRLTDIRITDAQLLFNIRRYDAAYYLAGYAVECALKAKIAQNVKRHDFPDKDTASKAYVHDLSALLRLAGMDRQLDLDKSSNQALAINWALVKDWSETFRYATGMKRQTARDLIQAISDPSDGILQWIDTN